MSPDPLDEYGAAIPLKGSYVEYTPELGELICERVAMGESISAICESPGMPSRRSVMRWLATNAGFERLYAFATQIRAEMFADEIVQIADEPAETNEAVQRQRVRVDSRKWNASHLLPRYADRVDVNAQTTLRLDAEPADVLESARRIAFALAAGDEAARAAIQPERPPALALPAPPPTPVYRERAEAHAVEHHPGRAGEDAQVVDNAIAERARRTETYWADTKADPDDFASDRYKRGQARREGGVPKERPKMINGRGPYSRR